MKRINRITSNIDFQKIIGAKKQVVTNSLILYYRTNEDRLRIGLSVSKKFGNAVVRNSVRRKTRAIIREMNILDLKYDVILIVRQSFINAKFEKQRKEVKKIFERLINEV